MAPCRNRNQGTRTRSRKPASRAPASASPQRGPRPPAHRRVRGARGVPRARRVAQPPAPTVREERSSVGGRRRGRRVRRRAGHRGAADRQPRPLAASTARSRASPRPSRSSRRAASRRSPRAPPSSTSSSAPRSGTPCPSASACTPSPRSAPPTGSPARSTTSDRDELLVSALLHDIGKLVLVHAYPGYPEQIHGDARTPEERVHRERRELGVDHGVVGGVLARRWGLPNRLATAIERHHSEDGGDEAALIRLADMLAHYGAGPPGRPERRC